MRAPISTLNPTTLRLGRPLGYYTRSLIGFKRVIFGMFFLRVLEGRPMRRGTNYCRARRLCYSRCRLENRPQPSSHNLCTIQVSISPIYPLYVRYMAQAYTPKRYARHPTWEILKLYVFSSPSRHELLPGSDEGARAESCGRSVGDAAPRGTVLSARMLLFRWGPCVLLSPTARVPAPRTLMPSEQ